MKHELTIIANDADIAREELERLLDGKLYKLDYEGYKRLAYPIDGHKYGHYFYVELELNRMEQRLLAEHLEYHANWALRFLLVRAETRTNNNRKEN